MIAHQVISLEERYAPDGSIARVHLTVCTTDEGTGERFQWGRSLGGRDLFDYRRRPEVLRGPLLAALVESVGAREYLAWRGRQSPAPRPPRRFTREELSRRVPLIRRETPRSKSLNAADEDD